MAIKQLFLKGLGIDILNTKYFIELKDKTYIFIVQWNTYCNCAFLSIMDYDNNNIVSGKALTNGLIIRNKNLPYTFAFTQINDETYEPTLENISTEFALVYLTEDDEV